MKPSSDPVDLQRRLDEAVAVMGRLQVERDTMLAEQKKWREAAQQAAEYISMIPLHTADSHALHFTQQATNWLTPLAADAERLDLVCQLVEQLQDANAQVCELSDKVSRFNLASGAVCQDYAEQMEAWANGTDDYLILKPSEVDVKAALVLIWGEQTDRYLDVIEHGQNILDLARRTATLLSRESALASISDDLLARTDALEQKLGGIPFIGANASLLVSLLKDKSVPGKIMAMEPVELLPGPYFLPSKGAGNVLPEPNEIVHIHLASTGAWHPYRVRGFYAWPDLGGNQSLHRVFVDLVSDTGAANSRLLCDIRRNYVPESEQEPSA